MKWNISDLNNQLETLHFKYVLDLSERLEKDGEILRIDPVTVKGQFNLIAKDIFEFQYKIETTIYLACAITLKEVPYSISEWVEDSFTKEGFDGHNYLDTDYIDLNDMVYSNILVLKPIRVVSNDSLEFVDEEERKVNDSFKDLEKFLKGDK